MVFPNYPRTVNSVQEILDLADKYQIPLSRCRFFINQDIQEPRAFGIYNDGINWIVYKNKANGERAIRYQGEDEAYAAQEIWSKFLSEVDARRSNGSSSDPSDGNVKTETTTTRPNEDPGILRYVFFAIFPFIIFAILVISEAGGSSSSYTGPYYADGYYAYGPTIYYYYRYQWYQLNDGEWSDYDGNLSGFIKSDYTGDYQFRDSDYYVRDSYSSSSSSDWDTDWDDWDSSDTDWDSDW